MMSTGVGGAAPGDDPSDREAGPLLFTLRDKLLASTDDNTAGGGNNNEDEIRVRLVLASQSPRRSEILAMMGLGGRFEAIPSPLDETALQLELLERDTKNTNPKDYTRILAEEKAKALADGLLSLSTSSGRNTPQSIVVLGSDTIVELDGHILEKPQDVADAKRMLAQLSGREHSVHTGVAIVRISSASSSSSGSAVAFLESSFVDTAVVRFARLAEADIEAYVKTGEPMDKAGSYGIQGVGGQFVSGIVGDFFTVMGLPMHRTSRELARVVRGCLLAPSSSSR